jgi:hypothetical protein
MPMISLNISAFISLGALSLYALHCEVHIRDEWTIDFYWFYI